MSGLQVRIDGKRYGPEGSDDGGVIIQDLAFEVAEGEMVTLHGPSGAGKTTLLGMLAGLDQDYDGEILWQSRPWNAAARGASSAWPASDQGSQRVRTRDRSDVQRLDPGLGPRLGMVFQEPRLMPWMSVRDNITLVLPDRKAEPAWVDELLDAVGLGQRANALPGELSGGMQRRVALARAFVVRPDLLLLDEPFVSLDLPTAQQLRELLLGLCRTLQPTVILVSHDLEDGIALADRMLFMSRSPARVVMEQALPALNSGNAGADDGPDGPDPGPSARNGTMALMARRRQTVEQTLKARPGLLSGSADMTAAGGQSDNDPSDPDNRRGHASRSAP